MNAKELVEKHPLILVGNHEQIIREIDTALHDAWRRGMTDAAETCEPEPINGSYFKRLITTKRDAAMPNVASSPTPD